MIIHEIFSSFQGEGKYTGYPTTFIRLFGCNLECIYCDQPQDLADTKKLSMNEIGEIVKSLGNKHVCITGGEPLLHRDVKDLTSFLALDGFIINVETNGSLDISAFDVNKVSVTMDIKTPSSQMKHFNHWDNLSKLREKDELKIVIGCEEDYEYAIKVINDYTINCPIIFSPMMEVDGTMLYDFRDRLLKDKPNNVKLGVQLHKLLNFR